MKRYAELHGNMQRYRIKSLYGNKLNLALMEDRSRKFSLLANHAAARFAEASRTPAMDRMVSMGERMKGLMSEKPHSTLGD